MNKFTFIWKKYKTIKAKKVISQDKLSKLADISLNTVVKIELDQNPNPTLETIRKLAKALGVSLLICTYKQNSIICLH